MWAYVTVLEAVTVALARRHSPHVTDWDGFFPELQAEIQAGAVQSFKPNGDLHDGDLHAALQTAVSYLRQNCPKVGVRVDTAA